MILAEQTSRLEESWLACTVTNVVQQLLLASLRSDDQCVGLVCFTVRHSFSSVCILTTCTMYLCIYKCSLNIERASYVKVFFTTYFL